MSLLEGEISSAGPLVLGETQQEQEDTHQGYRNTECGFWYRHNWSDTGEGGTRRNIDTSNITSEGDNTGDSERKSRHRYVL
jgi:hypothetical protein